MIDALWLPDTRLLLAAAAETQRRWVTISDAPTPLKARSRNVG
jgi:hypothetical protein